MSALKPIDAREIIIVAIMLILTFGTLASTAIGGLQSSQDVPSYGSINLGQSVQRPYVNGSKIMLNGREFVPIGVIKGWDTIYYPPNALEPTNWPDETEGVYNLLNDTKFNVVMISENRWLWENDPNYIPALQYLVDMCKERGLYVIIRYYSWLNENYSSPNYNTDPMSGIAGNINIIVELNGWLNHVTNIAQEFKNDTNVIGIDPFNEPPSAESWISMGYTSSQAQSIWYNNALQVIDAIHNVDPSFIIFVTPVLGELSLKDAIPWDRPNLVYTIHWYYGWDTEWGSPYADAYWNATTEEDFTNAYSLMKSYSQEILLNFRKQYNVPVMNSETSICKISYKSGDPCKNAEQEFTDQIRLGAQEAFGQLYWQMDRNVSPHYWGLLDANNLENWSDAGTLVKDAFNEYY